MSWPFSRKAREPTESEPARQRASLEAFLARHYKFVWRLMRGFGLPAPEAEDAAQQVFMIAARKLETIAPDRERSFLYGVSVRVANNARRGLRRRREVAMEPIEGAESAAESPEHALELANARALLADLLAELPDKLRRALVLAEIEELPVQAIAELERIPLGTAASRLRLARKQFRALLEGEKARNPFSEEW
ncbi:MAG TPA: RNA polymerase sigma factor [Polyangiaceae bacterium]|nr:RNA polymerase sigma factor [Polyangiaceae bacterium]